MVSAVSGAAGVHVPVEFLFKPIKQGAGFGLVGVGLGAGPQKLNT